MTPRRLPEGDVQQSHCKNPAELRWTAEGGCPYMGVLDMERDVASNVSTVWFLAMLLATFLL
jgi:hypothetical protein